MKLSNLSPMSVWPTALGVAIALGIVSGGMALKLAANRQADNMRSEKSAAVASSSNPTKAVLKPRTRTPTAANSSGATAADPTPPANAAAQTTAITITPIKPAAIAPLPTSATFNHLPYAEDDPARLQAVGSFVRGDYKRAEVLDTEAANAFLAMVAEAKAQGITLIPISGFRSVAEQQTLFAKQTEKYGSEAAAARLSAPPEYSEHHTGYAIDIGDGDRPEGDLSSQFAGTPAYQWLLNNAYRFGFEQSFPQDNPQGLSFEPWHWRYVESERAAQIFEAARAVDVAD